MERLLFVFKWLFIGTIGGFLYGFTSFFLITACLRDNIGAIIFYGLQGSLFVMAYLLLNKILIKFLNYRNNTISNIFIGIVSGLLSGSYNVIVTYYNLFESSPRNAAINFYRQITLELLYYLMGCILLGSIVGYLIGRYSVMFGNSRR